VRPPLCGVIVTQFVTQAARTGAADRPFGLFASYVALGFSWGCLILLEGPVGIVVGHRRVAVLPVLDFGQRPPGKLVGSAVSPCTVIMAVAWAPRKVASRRLSRCIQ
jgi:hypothetical protein